MKTKFCLFFCSGLILILLSGCVTGTKRKTIQIGNTIYEDVVVSANEKSLFMASPDQIHFTNLCPPGHFVEIRKGSWTIISGILPGETITLRPATVYRDDPVLFSTMVYQVNDKDEKVMVSFHNEILHIGGVPITASWDIFKHYASIRWDRRRSIY